MRRKDERNYKIIMYVIFLIGILIGSLFSNSLDQSLDQGAAQLATELNHFIENTNTNGLSPSYLIGKSFSTYTKQVLFIWLFCLFPITIPFAGLIIGIQGFAYGFTTSFFVMEYNLKGLLLCLAAYGLQGTILVFLLFTLAIEGIRFAKKDRTTTAKVYFMYLLGSICIVGLISLFESYMVPGMIGYIVRTFF